MHRSGVFRVAADTVSDMSEKPEPKQRKSSLATEVSKTEKRKKSVTMVEEKNETVEYEKQNSNDEEESNVDNFDLESPTDVNKTSGKKFSRFNDSMKINKRRMSREEKPKSTSETEK